MKSLRKTEKNIFLTINRIAKKIIKKKIRDTLYLKNQKDINSNVTLYLPRISNTNQVLYKKAIPSSFSAHKFITYEIQEEQSMSRQNKLQGLLVLSYNIFAGVNILLLFI